MQNINSESSLRNAILELETKQAHEEKRLKEQFQVTLESVRPVNLIKNILTDAVGSPDIKDNLLSTSVGLTAGFVSKALFQGITRSPIRKLIGTVLMLGITNLVAKNPEVVKSVGHRFFELFKKKKIQKATNPKAVSPE